MKTPVKNFGEVVGSRDRRLARRIMTLAAVKGALLRNRCASLGVIGALLAGTGCEEQPHPASAVSSTNAVAAAAATTPSLTNSAPILPTTPPPIVAAKPPPTLHPSVAEIVRFAEAGVDEPVMLAYLDTLQVPITLRADEIIYLTDLGVPGAVITMLLRLGEVRQTAAATAAATNAVPLEASVTSPPAANNPAPPGAAPVATAASDTPAESAPAAAATEPPPAPASQVTQTYFYETLAPYGSWVTVPGYGWCWRPTVAAVNPGWRPYCDRGRWYYTDCGWYWHSDYTWGYVPFHYGRWYSDVSLGWVWAPGTVWGPSWVTWRYGGGYCGWAPLPPAAHYSVGVGFTYYGSGVAIGFGFGLSSSAYCYVPTAYVCDYRPWVHAVPVGYANSFHGNTTVINNYVQGNGNNVIINAGVNSDVIASSAKGEIRRATLRDVTPGATPNSQPDRIIRGGSELAVYRPNLPGQAPEPPTHIRSRGEVARATAGAATPGAGGTTHLSGGGTADTGCTPVAGSIPTGSSSPRALPMSSRRNPVPASGDSTPGGSVSPAAAGAVPGAAAPHGSPAAPSAQTASASAPSATPSRIEPRRSPATSLATTPADRGVSTPATPSSGAPSRAEPAGIPPINGTAASSRRTVSSPSSSATLATTPSTSPSVPHTTPTPVTQPATAATSARTAPANVTTRTTPNGTDSRQEVRRAPGSTSAFPPPARYGSGAANVNPARNATASDSPHAVPAAPSAAAPAPAVSGPTIVRANRPAVAEPSRATPSPPAQPFNSVGRPSTPAPMPEPAYSPASRQVAPQNFGRPSYAPQSVPNQSPPVMRTQPAALPQAAPYAPPVTRSAPMANPTPVAPRVQSYSPPPAPAVQPSAPPMRSAPAPAPAPSGGGGGGGGGFGGRRQPN